MSRSVHLATFVEVVHRGTMAAAARHLKITTAAVSKQILTLEKELGVQLLNRSTRRITLTHEGEIYFEHAKKILNAYQLAEASLSQTTEEPAGTLKVVCGPQFGKLHVFPHLKEFLKRYPKLRVQIELTQTMPDLEKEKIDVVIGLTARIPQNCMQRSVMRARWVLCASPEYLEENGIPKKPADLAEHQIITHIRREPNNRITFASGESLHFEPHLYFNDTQAMRLCALHGVGIVQLHDYIIAKDLKEKRLIEILSPHTEQQKTIPIYVAYLQTSHLHIKVRKFIDFIVEKIGN